MRLLVEGRKGPEEAEIKNCELRLAGKIIGSGSIFFLRPDQEITPGNLTCQGSKKPEAGKTIVLLRSEDKPFQTSPILKILEE